MAEEAAREKAEWALAEVLYGRMWINFPEIEAEWNDLSEHEKLFYWSSIRAIFSRRKLSREALR